MKKFLALALAALTFTGAYAQEGKKDSVREAFLVARQVGAVIDLEKQNNAQPVGDYFD